MFINYGIFKRHYLFKFQIDLKHIYEYELFCKEMEVFIEGVIKIY